MANHELKNNITSYYEQTYERLRICSEYGETFTNDNVIPFVLTSIDYNQSMLVDKKEIRDELNNPVLVKLIKYQRNVKLFELNLLESAIAKNVALQKTIEIQVREL